MLKYPHSRASKALIELAGKICGEKPRVEESFSDRIRRFLINLLAGKEE